MGGIEHSPIAAAAHVWYKYINLFLLESCTGQTAQCHTAVFCGRPATWGGQQKGVVVVKCTFQKP